MAYVLERFPVSRYRDFPAGHDKPFAVLVDDNAVDDPRAIHVDEDPLGRFDVLGLPVTRA